MILPSHWFAGILAAPLFTLAVIAATPPRPVALIRRRQLDSGHRTGPSARSGRG